MTLNLNSHCKYDTIQGHPEEWKEPLDDAASDVYQTVELQVRGLRCASCERNVAATLSKMPGVISSSFSSIGKSGTVQFNPALVRVRDIVERILKMGYETNVKAEDSIGDVLSLARKEVRDTRHRMFLALSMQLPLALLMWLLPNVASQDVLIAFALPNGVPLYALIFFALATAIQIFVGHPFYVSSWHAIRNKQANMDVLIVLGTSSAYLYALWLVIYGYEDMSTQEVHAMSVMEQVSFLDTSSILFTIIIIGKYLEAYSKLKTMSQLGDLASLKVTRASLFIPASPDSPNFEGEEHPIDVELLAVGDLVRVANGNIAPADGRVIFGTGHMNESMLTGESKLVAKEPGTIVFGGTTLNQGALVVEITRTARNSSLSQIMDMVEKAQAGRAPIQRYADAIAGVFVPTIVVLGVLAWIIWFCLSYSLEGLADSFGETRFTFAFKFGISTMVIACPCALGLATPTAVMVACGISARQGILIKSGEVLEKVARITRVVFDKTGTLTTGAPVVVRVITPSGKAPEDRILFLALLAEGQSEHPIGRAIVRELEKRLGTASVAQLKETHSLENFTNHDGEGVETQVRDSVQNHEVRVLVGNEKLMKRAAVAAEAEMGVREEQQQGFTVVQVAVDGRVELALVLEETHLTKPESASVVRYLKEQGLGVSMITGDNRHAAATVAAHVGIEQPDVFAEMYPQNKKQAVQEMQARGERVLFVGDGVNDGPVLAQAEIGVAINSRSDVTVGAAGIVLVKDSLTDLVEALRIARIAFRRIKINFAWAFLYNLILVPVALGVLVPLGVRLPPILAGVAMAASSVSVVLSSLSLRLFYSRRNWEKEGEARMATEDSEIGRNGNKIANRRV